MTRVVPVLVLTLTLGAWLAGQPAARGEGAATAVASAQAAGTPAGYLRAAQNPDGGFGDAPGAGSSQLYAGWAALGLAAAGENPEDITRSGHSVIDYIARGQGSATDPGSIERTILVARAAGVSPYSFAARNLVAALEHDIRSNGSVSGQVNLTAFAILALRSAGAAPPAASIGWLLRQQDSDGGFNFAIRGGLSDPDDTGAALEALATAGGGAVVHARGPAVQFLRRQQDGDGGFPSQPGAGSNAQSTAFAVQGLLAAGVDASTVRRRGASPIDYLRSLIAADGHIRYSRATDQTPVWVTAEAIMALDGKALPLATVARRSAPRSSVPHLRHVPHARAATTPRGARYTPPIGTRGAARHRASHPSVRSATPSERAAPPNMTDRLVSDAGIITALLLAPVGAG